MPEYLAPGVYVEEVSFRSKSIEGVPTSTTGFAGMTGWGPVHYAGAPSAGPRLITSFADFERVYGGLEPLMIDAQDRVAYLSHAARAYFANGGKRLYVSRVYVPKAGDAQGGRALASIDLDASRKAVWSARWPGRAGNVFVQVKPVYSKNVRQAKTGAVVEVITPRPDERVDENRLPEERNLLMVRLDDDGRQHFFRGDHEQTPDLGKLYVVELRVRVQVNAERTDVYDELGADVSHKRYIGRILGVRDPEDENAMVSFDVATGGPVAAPIGPAGPAAPGATSGDVAGAAAPGGGGVDDAIRLVTALVRAGRVKLQGGNDGDLATPDDLAGKEANPDDPTLPATGLEALADVDDIAIVALPDAGAYDGPNKMLLCGQAADRLITHATRLRYRIAVLDGPRGSSISQIREFRGRFDSKYAALYHPWIEILDPLERASQGAPPRRIMLPPSGFVTGIYARSDIERGVHKAPANEVVRGLTRLEVNINTGRQEVINPEGINALRFFEGRGNRVWGARTISSDPEWKYVNVRRLFAYLEHSIDKGTQWAVFEPNNEMLWRNIRYTIEDFLLVLWKDGALLGSKPEEAYFVRCDRTTMTQNDIDNGRMVCLIGVAPTKPAEFVIFRIGQWTSNAKQA